MLLPAQFRYIFQPKQELSSGEKNTDDIYIKEGNINNIIKTLPRYNAQHKTL
jgi:hypothetical protein